MDGKGNRIKSQQGNLLLKVLIRPHPYFRRDGSNIITEKKISFTQAILGG